MASFFTCTQTNPQMFNLQHLKIKFSAFYDLISKNKHLTSGLRSKLSFPPSKHTAGPCLRFLLCRRHRWFSRGENCVDIDDDADARRVRLGRGRLWKLNVGLKDIFETCFVCVVLAGIKEGLNRVACVELIFYLSGFSQHIKLQENL